ncbi:hypothetical protein [Paraburkholderia sediminicola]|uniref:hypothetical protein n=1 Tax=Paraburkholderia sediminicola TaxID=458836 RepID=UPI0038B85FA2
MNKLGKDVNVSQRLRELIVERYPARGRFTALGQLSEINANRWKNFYYQKQEAAADMVEFWCKKYPMDERWLTTGIRAPAQDGYPFAAPVPMNWEGQTIGDRLVWVIKEWAAPRAEQLFAYLEEKSAGQISAAEWSRVILRLDEPSLAMVQLVCKARPIFTQWVLLGWASKSGGVDPTDATSVELYKKRYPGWFEKREVEQMQNGNQED